MRKTEVTINGRFLTQKMTGVQRYALEIVHAIDRLIDAKMYNTDVLVAKPVHTDWKSLNVKVTGFFNGVVWEQTLLALRAKGHLFCLGNSAPILYKNKTVCIHDVNFLKEPGSYSYGFRKYMQYLSPLVAKSSRLITTVSPYSAQTISDAGICRYENIVIAPNGHEHVFRWDSEQSAVAEDNNLRQPFILLVGSMAQHKNWALISSISERIVKSGCEIVAVGAGGHEFTSVELGKFQHFKILEAVSDNDLAWLYKSAECLVFPSLTEGFGLPLVEAMALGCPVITSNRASMPWIVGDAGIVLDVDDPELWLKNIEHLIGESVLKSRIIEKAGKRVQKFSWNKSALAYLAVLTGQNHEVQTSLN